MQRAHLRIGDYYSIVDTGEILQLPKSPRNATGRKSLVDELEHIPVLLLVFVTRTAAITIQTKKKRIMMIKPMKPKPFYKRSNFETSKLCSSRKCTARRAAWGRPAPVRQNIPSTPALRCKATQCHQAK